MMNADLSRALLLHVDRIRSLGIMQVEKHMPCSTLQNERAPDERRVIDPLPESESLVAIQDVRGKRNLTRYGTVDAMFAELDVDD